MNEDIERICDLLATAYGTPEWFRHNAPLDELVLTILSQNTTSLNCRRAYDSLRAAFPSWEDARTATTEQIAASIRSGGLSNIKAGRIRSILQRTYELRGEVTLDWLESLPLEEAYHALLEFDGVGPKTAACVLLFSFGWPALPVDTHVHRVTRRLGLVPATANAEAAQDMLQRIIPPSRMYSFHINVICLGREICKPRAPICEICVLKWGCDFGRKRLGPD